MPRSFRSDLVFLALCLIAPSTRAQTPMPSPVAPPAGSQTAAPQTAAPQTSGPQTSLPLLPTVPPPPPAPQLPDPVTSAIVPNGIRFLNNNGLVNFCTRQVAGFNGRDADMIFIGDSITQGWVGAGKAVWDANFAPRSALDFGVSGDQTQHVLWRLDNYPVARLHPKVAVVLIGTNNLHHTAPEIAAGVKAVLTKTQTLYPGIKIILVSIMPNARANDLMMSADTILKTFADNQTIYYLDLVPLMTPVGDNWKGLSKDHLHPDATGYQLWADALLPLVNKLMPAPLAVGVPVQQ